MGVMDLRRNIILNEPHIATVTGNPVSVKTDIKGLLSECTVSWEPVQEGTGDPSPSNERNITGMTGARVWHYRNNVLRINRTSSATVNGITFTPVKNGNNEVIAVRVKGTNTSTNTFLNLNYVNSSTLSIQPGSYKIYGVTDNVRMWAFYHGSDNVDYQAVRTVDGIARFTIPQNAVASWIRLQISDLVAIDETIYPIIVAENDPFTTYPVTFPAMGKNLCGSVLEQGGLKASTGMNDESNQRVRTKDYIFLKQGTYTVSATGVGQGFFFVYDEDKTYLQSESNGTFHALPWTITLVGDRYIRIVFRVSSSNENVTPSDVSNVMLNAGSTAEAYEPYTNTVYGGSLDVVTGELVAEWAESDLSTWEWSTAASSTRIRSSSVTDMAIPTAQTIKGDFFGEQVYSVPQTYTLGNYPNGMAIMAAGYWYKYFDGTNYPSGKIVYRLATPKIYHLTPQQIKSLIGDNTIWSDANGNIQIKLWKH